MILAYVTCSQNHSSLSQCVDLEEDVGVKDKCQHTAGVICVTRDNSNRDGVQETSQRDTNLTLPILLGAVCGTLAVMVIVITIMMIIVLVILRKKQKSKN